MAARRIAANQPDSFAFSAVTMEKVHFWLNKYPAERKRSAVIPLLWLAQEQEGWVSEPAMRVIADMLEMAQVRVMEVATFYTMFNLQPVGRFFVQLCGTSPCMIRGAEELKSVCEEKIGPQNQVTSDGVFSWLEVECLGACCNAPMVQINTDYYEDLTPASFAQLLDDLAVGRPTTPGPQNGRQTSAPLGEPTTLTDPSLFDGSRASLVSLPNTGSAEATE